MGQAVITTGGRLKTSYVIHTVGPVWNGGKSNETELLRECYFNSLTLAVKHQCKTVAFPNISTGIYRFPKDIASTIAIETVTHFESKSIEEVTFVCFDQENFVLYESGLQ